MAEVAALLEAVEAHLAAAPGTVGQACPGIDRAEEVVRAVQAVAALQQKEKAADDEEHPQQDATALKLARQLLRARGREQGAGKALFAPDAIAAYLACAEGAGALCRREEAVACLVNAIHLNAEGFANLESQRGYARVLKVFRAGGSALLLQRCVRLLNLGLQHQLALRAHGQGAGPEVLAQLVNELSKASISCLVFCVRDRSQGPFPGQDAARVELCKEILGLQMVLAAEVEESAVRGQGAGSEEFTQLGMVLTELLLLPIDLPHVFPVKARVLNVLSFMPDTFCNFLTAHHAFPALLEVLERQMLITGVQGAAEYEARLLPGLMVLSKAVENCALARPVVEELLFPEDDEEEVEEARARAQMSGAQAPQQNMEPSHAAPGSVAYGIIKLMQSSSDQVSQLTGEMLWQLCGRDSARFTRRTGLGNAVGMLQLKGLLDVSGAPTL